MHKQIKGHKYKPKALRVKKTRALRRALKPSEVSANIGRCALAALDCAVSQSVLRQTPLLCTMAAVSARPCTAGCCILLGARSPRQQTITCPVYSHQLLTTWRHARCFVLRALASMTTVSYTAQCCRLTLWLTAGDRCALRRAFKRLVMDTSMVITSFSGTSRIVVAAAGAVTVSLCANHTCFPHYSRTTRLLVLQLSRAAPDFV